MKKNNFVRLSSLGAAAVMFLAACAPAATPEVQIQTQVVVQTSAPQVQTQVVVQTSAPVVQTQVVNQTQIVEVTPTPGANPEAVIPNVEPNAEIHFWTFYLSPTFDD